MDADFNPLVSICLPTLNALRFLEPRMDSILAQTLTDWELIVCDSFSDDGTWEYFQQFKDDPRVRLYQVPKEGLYAGWNECLKRCRGEYVYIATADDTMAPECLERMVAALGKTESRKQKAEIDPTTNEERKTRNQERPIDICVCDFDFIDVHGSVIPPPRSVPSCELGVYAKTPHVRCGLYDFLVTAILGVSWTTMTAVLFRRSLLDRVGLFRTDSGVSADRFWAMKACAGSDVVYVSEKLATWRFHPGQQSGVMSRRDYHRAWLRLLETVRECESLLPDRWKQDRNWIDRITWQARAHYLKLFCLERQTLMNAPWRTAKGVLQAAFLDPGYLLRRIGLRFSWETWEFENNHMALRVLREEWDVPWPPVVTGRFGQVVC